MALGGGSFSVAGEKVLPGMYSNFYSLAAVSAASSSRGVTAMPLSLDWGPADTVMEITAEYFFKDPSELLGYSSDYSAFKGLRDLFKSATVLYAYRLNGGGQAAKNSLAMARYPGTRGNDLLIKVQGDVDDESSYNVSVYLSGKLTDTQKVKSSAELTDTSYVKWDKTAELTETAGSPLIGGTNGSITVADYQAFLDKIEGYSFNALGAVTDDTNVCSLIAAFCRRQRDEQGRKFQAVLHSMPADYEGVVNVKNAVSDTDEPTASLVYWVTGAVAGCEVNKSIMNRTYDGEFSADVNYTQGTLSDALQAGEFVFHRVGYEVRVLKDINSLVTYSDTKSALFQSNQTIRVLDEVGIRIGKLFNDQYLGKIQNNDAGRTSLWNNAVDILEGLQTIGALQDFASEHVEVDQLNKESAIMSIMLTPVGAFGSLYASILVK